MAKILVTGGAGYIGSHTCVELLNSVHEVAVLDNLCNSSEQSLNRVQVLTGKTLTFVEGDISDAQVLDQVFQQYFIDAVIHYQAKLSIFRFIEKYYNKKRLQTDFNSMSTNQFEAL